MSYVFKNYIESLIDNNILFYNGDLDITKGMASFTGKFKLINLSAEQWKGIPEQLLIDEIIKTDVHEELHLLIDVCESYTSEGEETVCQIMADQVWE